MKTLSAHEMANLVWGAYSGRRIMVTVRAAFDSSKDHPCGSTVVAGYIADADKWQDIEEPWNLRLRLEGLEEFHLSEIKSRFTNWKAVVKPFADLASDADLRCVYAAISDNEWAGRTRDPQYEKDCPFREHACLDLLFTVLAEEAHQSFKNEPVAIVFDGDWGNHEAVLRVYNAWRERTNHLGFNILLKAGVPWRAVPLQCADMLAGLLRLSPVTKARLNGVLDADGGELGAMQFAATANGRGALWSEALAKLRSEVS